MKGIHLSPGTEFKKGQQALPLLPIGSVRFRKHKGDKKRAWIKVADPNTWIPRASAVWIANHGTIPRGMIIHHKDRDTLNDNIGNLELMTRSQHLAEHREEIRRGR